MAAARPSAAHFGQVASDVPPSLALPPRLIDDAAFRRQVRATLLDQRLEAALEAPNSEGLRRNLPALLTPIFRDPEWLGMLWPSGARPSFDPGGDGGDPNSLGAALTLTIPLN